LLERKKTSVVYLYKTSKKTCVEELHLGYIFNRFYVNSILDDRDIRNSYQSFIPQENLFPNARDNISNSRKFKVIHESPSNDRSSKQNLNYGRLSILYEYSSIVHPRRS